MYCNCCRDEFIKPQNGLHKQRFPVRSVTGHFRGLNTPVAPFIPVNRRSAPFAPTTACCIDNGRMSHNLETTMTLTALCTALLLTSLHLPALAAPASGIDNASIDPAIRVQDDLFLSANGAWLQTTAIPEGKSFVLGVDINDINDARIEAIATAAAGQRAPTGAMEQKVGDYYASYNDTGAIDQAGLRTLRRVLTDIAALPTPGALAAWHGRMHGLVQPPVWLRVFPDLKNPGQNRVMTWQGGLGLPDRAFYLASANSAQASARAAYRAYLAQLATLAGMPEPARVAERVLALETRIAQTHWQREHTGDVGNMYHPMKQPQLAAAAPGYDWHAFLQGAGVKEAASINVTMPSAVSGTAALYTEIALRDWKAYTALRFIDATATVLPAPFRAARFAYRGKALGGATVPAPRWQQAIASLNEAMGEGVGQLYVKAYFSPAHKAKAQQIATDVLAAYQDAISASGWMSPATKAQALDKLSRYGTKIGYPDIWRDYSALDVRRGDALGNQVRAARFNWTLQAAKADRPVDRREWQFTPQTTDAMYDPMLNEIVFPAATLQRPFLDLDADDAANYGAIGVNIGHEISHGFDAMGSQFDGAGVMRNWWQDSDRKAYDALGDRLIAQYSAIEALPGQRINGRLTLSENLADLAGMQAAFKAYQRSLGGKPSPVIDGRTGEQRFFLAAAQFRRVKMRDAAMTTMLASDPHAPHAARANGPAIHIDGFHDAFATRPGDAMYRPAAERIRIW